MLRLFIVRHGTAADRTRFEGADASRPLTPKGRRRLQKTSRALARTGERIDRLFTSPLVRAVQTAEILARALRLDRVDVLEQLAPGADPDALLRVLAAATKKGESIALASHDPLTSRLVARLCGPADFDFPKGAVVRIDVPALGGKAKDSGKVRWTLHPKDKSPRDGLPGAAMAKRQKEAPKAKFPQKVAKKAKPTKAKPEKAQSVTVKPVPRQSPPARKASVRRKPVGGRKPAPAPAARPLITLAKKPVGIPAPRSPEALAARAVLALAPTPAPPVKPKLATTGPTQAQGALRPDVKPEPGSSTG